MGTRISQNERASNPGMTCMVCNKGIDDQAILCAECNAWSHPECFRSPCMTPGCAALLKADTGTTWQNSHARYIRVKKWCGLMQGLSAVVICFCVLSSLSDAAFSMQRFATLVAALAAFPLSMALEHICVDNAYTALQEHFKAIMTRNKLK